VAIKAATNCAYKTNDTAVAHHMERTTVNKTPRTVESTFADVSHSIVPNNEIAKPTHRPTQCASPAHGIILPTTTTPSKTSSGEGMTS